MSDESRAGNCDGPGAEVWMGLFFAREAISKERT